MNSFRKNDIPKTLEINYGDTLTEMLEVGQKVP